MRFVAPARRLGADSKRRLARDGVAQIRAGTTTSASPASAARRGL